MIIQFKIHTAPQLLTANLSSAEVAKLLNEGMIGNQRVKSVMLHSFEASEDDGQIWYHFDDVKAGLPGFTVVPESEEEPE